MDEFSGLGMTSAFCPTYLSALCVSTLYFCLALYHEFYKILAIYSVNGSQESRETWNISRARDKYSELLQYFIHKKKMSMKLRLSVTCILYRRKLPNSGSHIKFLQNASFLRKLNPLNFALTYWIYHFLDHFNLWKLTLLNRTISF